MEQETEYKTSRNVNQGANIRNFRQGMGIKQEDLAVKLGYSQQYISQLEQRKVIGDMELVKKIAYELNVPAKLILEMEENPVSIVIENNTIENNSFQNSGGVKIGYENNDNIENNFYSVDKIADLIKESSTLCNRICEVEKEKSELLEEMMKNKQE